MKFAAAHNEKNAKFQSSNNAKEDTQHNHPSRLVVDNNKGREVKMDGAGKMETTYI